MKLSTKTVLAVVSSLLSPFLGTAKANTPQVDLSATANHIQELNKANAFKLNEAGELVVSPSLLDELKSKGFVTEEFASGDGWTPKF